MMTAPAALAYASGVARLALAGSRAAPRQSIGFQHGLAHGLAGPGLQKALGNIRDLGSQFVSHVFDLMSCGRVIARIASEIPVSRGGVACFPADRWRHCYQ